ncbi:ABC transporter ATP-binding protein [Nakamurella sp. PAMC28650]|uniref:oligopeptide/dipeptide ABC transporter ATP-binding protein n=1 Tax=Nakamurella sp. PAMC28650 TaxID=2762325 RepID=UPI001C9A57EE|nr:ABC transporter ATP-binding protein [Nakamurella sp. PAMC28650]
MTGTAATPVAVIENLTITLTRRGQASQVLRNLDLQIGRGEILGLVGESGSGKSVLGLAMMGLLPPRSQPQVRGAIRIAGTDMVHGSASAIRAVRRQHLGVIFQDPMTSLNPTMRVGRQIIEMHGDEAEAVRLLAEVGVSHPEQRIRVFPHELSGGLRQRVMAAIAVSGRPSLIIADEPTTALDVTVQAQLLDMLRGLRDELGCSVLFITHDLAVAAQIADRIAVLYAGRLAEIGPTRTVLTRPAHPYTVGLLRSRLSLDTPRDEVLATMRPEPAGAAVRPDGCAYHSRCPVALERCATEAPPLTTVLGVPGAGGHLRACWRAEDEVRQLATGHEPPVPHAEGVVIAKAAPAVQISGLRVVFRPKSGARRAQPMVALDGVDLTVAAGEAVSIVGESGSGKSTLLRVIAGILLPTGGTVTIGPGGAQMVYQDAGSSLTPWLTVGELLRERLRPLRLGRTAADARVAEALERIGLPAEVARVRPPELSGGQRQRVALVRATIIPPAVLLCDEPTSALDASLAATVLNLIRELRARLSVTVLFVTHDLAVARLMGERIVVMTQGVVVESGTAADVIGSPSHPYTRSLLAAVPEIGAPR